MMKVTLSDRSENALYIALGLSCVCDRYRARTVADVERLFWTAIQTQQYRIAVKDGCAVGFVSWAYLSEEVATGFANRTRLLQPADWRSGNHIWIIDLLAPFGHCREFVGHLRQDTFAGCLVHASRMRPGGGRDVARYIGEGYLNEKH